MAFDDARDTGLRMIDTSHLFERTTRRAHRGPARALPARLRLPLPRGVRRSLTGGRAVRAALDVADRRWRHGWRVAMTAWPTSSRPSALLLDPDLDPGRDALQAVLPRPGPLRVLPCERSFARTWQMDRQRPPTWIARHGAHAPRTLHCPGCSTSRCSRARRRGRVALSVLTVRCTAATACPRRCMPMPARSRSAAATTGGASTSTGACASKRLRGARLTPRRPGAVSAQVSGAHSARQPR